jgi:hypothetical protein
MCHQPHGLEASAKCDFVHPVRRTTSAREDNWDESSGAVTDRAHPSHASGTNEAQFFRLPSEARV